MTEINEMIPNPDDLLALEVEELAGVLLEYLNAAYPNEPDPVATPAQMHRYNFFNHFRKFPL